MVGMHNIMVACGGDGGWTVVEWISRHFLHSLSIFPHRKFLFFFRHFPFHYLAYTWKQQLAHPSPREFIIGVGAGVASSFDHKVNRGQP